MGFSTIKPCCRFLISSSPYYYSSSSLLGFSSRFLGFGRLNHSINHIKGQPQIRVCCSTSHINTASSSSFNNRGTRGISVIPNVASSTPSSARFHSTSAGGGGGGHVHLKDTAGNTSTSFERIYVQGVVKPLAADNIGTSTLDLLKEEQQQRRQAEVITSAEEVRPQRHISDMEKEAWKLLEESVVTYCGTPVGTVAANDPLDKQPLNYDQVFIRDFVPSALAFLLKGQGDIVRNFLLHTLQLQSWEKTVDCYSPGQGLMPASFKVRTVPLDGSSGTFEEVLDPDFGESAIGRVAPVDSGFLLW